MTASALEPARRVGCLGVYILDVLGRAIDELPKIQLSLVIDEIRMTAAGTAGGTSVDLARLGADVRAIGAVGEDHLGTFLLSLLEAEGVSTGHVVRKAGVQTASTILPISSQGIRPGWHAAGANRRFGPEDVPAAALDDLDVLHYGGVSALPGLDGEPAREILALARSRGTLTTADCLGIKRPDTMELLARSLPFIDIFMPNRDEARMLTGRDDPREAAAQLQAASGGWVVVKLDAEGCLGVGDGAEFSVATPEVPVVDTTGCGDAFCSGLIMGRLLGWPTPEAARLGIAAGALTAGGLGSDAGIVSLAGTAEFMRAKVPEARG